MQTRCARVVYWQLQAGGLYSLRPALSMVRPFVKYEGLGNDFLVLDAATWPLSDLVPALARALCDRHTGVGGDGLLWVGPGDADGIDARLIILNADGSRPEMCGNGVRC